MQLNGGAFSRTFLNIPTYQCLQKTNLRAVLELIKLLTVISWTENSNQILKFDYHQAYFKFVRYLLYK